MRELDTLLQEIKSKDEEYTFLWYSDQPGSKARLLATTEILLELQQRLSILLTPKQASRLVEAIHEQSSRQYNRS